MSCKSEANRSQGAVWRWLIPGLVCAGGLAIGLLAGCSANDPFDPESVANRPPTVRFSVVPVESGGELAPTSYNKRKFHWSGSDPDGWVTEFYVSIRTEASVPAPWVTTTRTDTTMTFVTDGEGNAEATVLLACRDDRGAVSDTLVQFIPLKNFPPTVKFQSDFDPLKNMQRVFLDIAGNEIEDPGDPAVADTVYWNWGAMNFRLFAIDLDGVDTIDPFFTYTLADGEPTGTYDVEDPLADPNLHWVRAPFGEAGEVVATFEIFVADAAPSEERTLRVLVKDEADGGEPFSYTWQVREPKGPLLYVPDNSSVATADLYRDGLEGHLGADNWDEYSFWFGIPDHPFVLIETLRKFEAVLWTDGGGASTNIRAGTNVPDGFLTQYLSPDDGSTPGKLFIVSRVLTGLQSGISGVFLQGLLGISPTALPATPLRYPVDKSALGLQPHLPAMTSIKDVEVGGVGLKLVDGADVEAIYQMEYCLCYGDDRRPAPPYDPLVGVRTPARTTSAEALTVAIGLQLDNFDHDQVVAAVAAILGTELGVSAP